MSKNAKLMSPRPVIKVIQVVQRSHGASFQRSVNKDNKALFGKLIKTERKLNDSLKMKNRMIGVPPSLPKPPRHAGGKLLFDRLFGVADLSKLMFYINPDKYIKQCNAKRIHVMGFNKENTDTRNKSFQDLYTAVKFSDLSSLKLPESVIKTLTTFPMVNKEKDSKERPDICAVVSSDNLRFFPSVTKILNMTMSASSKAALNRWRAKLVEQLGEEGFQRHQQAQLSQGAKLHQLIQSHLLGEKPTVSPDLEGCWSSLQSELSHIGKVQVTEQSVFHPWLLYHGIIDCIAMYDDDPVIIEWKKSEKIKTNIGSTFDAPLQLAAYMGALNFDQSCKYKVKGGKIIIAYTDGTPARAFSLKTSEFAPHWLAFLRRLQQFWRIQQDTQEAQ